jgi:hypothetical protein
MSIKKIWGSRVHSTGSTYIAEAGLIFYDETDGELRLGNGVTPGGVAISVRADLITAQRLLPGLDNNNAYGLGDETHRWWDLHIGDGGIHYNGFEDPQLVPYIPGAQVDDIIPALDNDISLGSTSTRFANLYLGYQGLFLADETTDENINITVDSGTLYIDGAENLRLGNLAIRDTTLTSANSTLDISIGNAGDTGFFYVKRKAQIDNTTFSSTQAMLGINASGVAEPDTVFPDTLVQAVGRPNKNSRVVQRSYGSTGVVGGDNSYAVWASYAARGSVASPAALKANDILMRLSGNGYGTSTWGAGGARIEYVALENFTDSAKGTKINFWTTPVGQTASQTVASINSTGVVTAGVKFSGDETLQTTAGIPLSAKAVSSATYVATLGIDGKLDASQIPASLTGAIVFKGTWNANTNTPALSDTTPAGLVAGWEYVVDVGGTRDIGDGSKTFAAGDFVIYDGTHWKQVPSGNLFTSLTGGGGITVNQSTGAIVLGSSATPLSTTATIVSRDSSGNFAANMISANLTGVVTGSVSGNAGSVTNGVYTNGSYSDPSWLTLSKSKVGLGNVENTALSTSTHFIGTTSIQYNRASASQTLTGVSIDGSAGSVAALNITGTTLTATVVTSSLTTVGTLTNLTVTNLVTAKNYSGQVRNLGTITAGAGTEITIDFATDHMVRFNYTTEPVQVAFTNYSAGKTVTLIAVNTNAANRQLQIGIDAANAQGASTLDINGNTTGIVTYYCTGATVNDVFASAVYTI